MLNLKPSETHPPLSIHGLDKKEEAENTVGATIAAWEWEGSKTVRWVSASALENAPLGFGTTRLMAWVSFYVSACPHFVMELGALGSATIAQWRVQGTLSFAQKSDLILDLEYLDRYYTTKGSETSNYSFKI